MLDMYNDNHYHMVRRSIVHFAVSFHQNLPSNPSEITDLIVIGAGLHSLTLVSFLLDKRPQFRDRLQVIDPSGTWMQAWNTQFAAQEIPHLRSPAVHHPDPNSAGLRTFAEGRFAELYPPYDRPGTQLFQEFCEAVIARHQLQEGVHSDRVVQIEPIQISRRSRFRLRLANGSIVVARRVVLATGQGAPQVPDWVNHIPTGYPIECLCHSSQVNLRLLHCRGERILIVGGGQTTGHLALGALQRGATVTLMLRRTLQEKLFDADPGWLGPKYLKHFWAETNWHKRGQMIQSARNGGSMAPEVVHQLRRYREAGALIILEHCQIQAAQWQQPHWQVQCDTGDLLTCDRLWYATGHQLNAATHPLLQQVQSLYPTELINGLPVLDPYLRWPGCELFISGGLAALQLGPVARNLSGARAASGCIVEALLKPSLSFSSKLSPDRSPKRIGVTNQG
jgi:cation diffusion facilitator CzcD-associated flavoprotein CzcO